MIYIKSGHNEAICSSGGSVLRHIYRTNVQDWSENSKSGKINKKNIQTRVIFRGGRAACGVGGVGVLAWARPAKINVTGVCLMVSVSPPPRHWDTALGVVLTGT